MKEADQLLRALASYFPPIAFGMLFFSLQRKLVVLVVQQALLC